MKNIVKFLSIFLTLSLLLTALCSCTSDQEITNDGDNLQNNVINNKSENSNMSKNSSAKEETPKVEKTLKNVFFSPYTGSDDNDGLNIGTPVLTYEKAQEISKGLTLGENEEAVILEYLMTVNVKTQQAYGVSSEAGGVNMIPFTGSCESHWFTGEIQGTGCDTQKYPPEGGAIFSARYLLKGKDADGKACSIFIENNGTALDLCTPTVITDSELLKDWQYWDMRAIVVPVSGGVDVNVFKIR